METVVWLARVLQRVWLRIFSWLIASFMVIKEYFGLTAWFTLFAFGFISAIAAMMSR